MSTSTSTRRGFACKCLSCGEPGYIRIYLHDTTGTDDQFECMNCDHTFSADDVRQFISTWQATLTWLESAPEFVDV